MTRREFINQERADFETKDILIVEGFSFNQKQTINRIYRYYNSKFENGDTDADGDKKYFYNIVRNPCKVTTKGIDFDPKDIRILTASGGSPLQTWFFERDLKYWMKEQQFGKVLNRIFEELPIFGSVVIKMVGNKPEFIDLRNFIVDQSADSLDCANYIIERHLYTPIEFRKIAEEMKWESVDEVLEEHFKTKAPYIAVYERYGDIEDQDEDGNKTRTYKRLVLADVGKNEKDQQSQLVYNTQVHPGFVLEEVDVKDHPYWEFHMEKMPGRWLGVGVVEVLFDPQVRQNEIANLQAKASYWNAARLFQTADEGINKNLKSDLKDGDVLNPDSPITQIAMPDRNLAFFTQETQKWMSNSDDLTFRYEVVSGQRLPAGTPLGSARIAAAMTGAYFEHIRENIALEVKAFLYGAVLPSFAEENSKEHLLRIVGDDLDTINSMIISQLAIDELFSYILNNEKLPTIEVFDILKATIGERAKQGKEKLIKIPAGFYKGLKYKLDIVITGQYRDIAVQAQTMFAALQAITVDPTLLVDPTKKKFFYQWLEAGGINPSDFEPDVKPPSIESLTEGTASMPTPMPPTQQRGGGGVSAPATITPEAVGGVAEQIL